jgi:hypothetical protein
MATGLKLTKAWVKQAIAIFIITERSRPGKAQPPPKRRANGAKVTKIPAARANQEKEAVARGRGGGRYEKWVVVGQRLV